MRESKRERERETEREELQIEHYFAKRAFTDTIMTFGAVGEVLALTEVLD